MNLNSIKDKYHARSDKDLVKKLANTTVGIAGCGGLGSNAAIMLARAGVGTIILADYDKVEASNLNRQSYTTSDISDNKVDALYSILADVNPFTNVICHNVKLNEDNIDEIFDTCDILLECFDDESEKSMLITHVLTHFSCNIVAVSGISGTDFDKIKVINKFKRLFIVTDENCNNLEFDKTNPKLCSAKVMLVASMQALTAIQLLQKS